MARCFGVALLALSLAVWPRGAATVQATRAMLLYNAGLAIYFAWIGATGLFVGPMLWPVAIIHGVVAALLSWPLNLGAGAQANR